MIRALVTAVLLAGATTQLRVPSVDPLVAAGYVLVGTMALWLFWPLLRRVGPATRRRKGGGRRRPPSTAPTGPHLTQVNHYHFYGQTPAAAAARPDLSQPALQRRTRGQQAHDAIYDIIDIDDDTTR